MNLVSQPKSGKAKPAQLQIVYRKVAELIPYARNARTHSDAQVAEIAASIKEFGWINPVVIDGDSGIIAGHGRVLAARVLKMEQVPCISADHLTESQKRAYILADNKIAENAGWDKDLLKVELGALIAEGFDVSLTGFDGVDLDRLMGVGATEGNTDPDEVGEVPERPVSKPGDIWLLGDHRLICGDVRDAAVFTLLLEQQKADMIFTDPPYNVAVEGGNRDTRGKKPGGKTIKNDDLQHGEFKELLEAAFKAMSDAAKAGATAFVCYGDAHAEVTPIALKAVGWSVRQRIVWVKDSFVLSPLVSMGICDYHPQHEGIVLAAKPGAKRSFYGEKNQSTVWQIPRPKKTTDLHPSVKPAELVAKAILNNSKAGDIVLDPFMGSGTTIIAAHAHDRCAYGIELDPAYCDVAIKRWQVFAGEEARLAGTKKTFAQVAKDRI